MSVPFMIEIGHDEATRQARSGWVSLTLIEANVAKLVEEGLSSPEAVVNLLLSRRTVAATSRMLAEPEGCSPIGIAREPALRAATSR